MSEKRKRKTLSVPEETDVIKRYYCNCHLLWEETKYHHKLCQTKYKQVYALNEYIVGK